jgi:hypothetical protein
MCRRINTCMLSLHLWVAFQSAEQGTSFEMHGIFSLILVDLVMSTSVQLQTLMVAKEHWWWEEALPTLLMLLPLLMVSSELCVRRYVVYWIGCRLLKEDMHFKYFMVSTTFQRLNTFSILLFQQSHLKAARVNIFVRRGGPNYQKGLANMRSLGQETGVPIEVLYNSLVRALHCWKRLQRLFWLVFGIAGRSSTWRILPHLRVLIYPRREHILHNLQLSFVSLLLQLVIHSPLVNYDVH